MSDLARLATTWSFPTRVHFGAGSIEKLAPACREAGMTRPLLVTDPGLAAMPMVGEALAALQADGPGAAIFSGIRSNPTEGNVLAGVAALRAGDHDGVVAMGGGSALDAGKAVAFMTAQTRSIFDFEDIGDLWKQAEAEGILPVVAVPTTAGTGSEVGRAAVITDEAGHRKKIIFHPRMLPETAILDPELTLGLPPHLTAATGMDALAHCLEAYCAPGFHPMCEGIAVEGIRLVKDALHNAVRDGTNLSARARMLAASSMGAVAFQKGLGAIHALSHPIGAVYDTHHGLANAVVMPYVLAFNRDAIDDKLVRLGAWLGLDPSFDAVLNWVLELRRELAIPHTLHDLGIEEDRFRELAAMAETDPTASGNPVPVKAPELELLYRHAFTGQLA
jgi:alcohol dehydrogenase class IV